MPDVNAEQPGKWSRKPTATELRAILNAEEDMELVILPNGEVRAKSDKHLKEVSDIQTKADKIALNAKKNQLLDELDRVRKELAALNTAEAGE